VAIDCITSDYLSVVGVLYFLTFSVYRAEAEKIGQAHISGGVSEEKAGDPAEL